MSDLRQLLDLKTVMTLILGIGVLSASVIRGDELISVGLQKQLLVDDYVIAEKHNVTRVLGRVEKIGMVMEPSLPTDCHPTMPFPKDSPDTCYFEFARRLSVVWNEYDQKFQMLYRACGESYTGYAESTDGIHWSKPAISEDGNSNLITYRGKTSGTFYEAAFTIDPTLPWGHPEKYKAAFNPGNVMCAIAHSADGIHWQGYNHGQSVTGRAADTFNQILWDPIGSRYMLLTRTDIGSTGGLTEDRASRVMAHTGGNDLNAHPAAWETLVDLEVDDPENEKTPAGVAAIQMESMTIWPYENIYFGLMHILTLGELTGAEGKIPVADPDARPEKDVIDFYIGTSRDGANFDKSWIFARNPLIERGPDGSFDKAMIQPASEIITRGDEHWIYYTGAYSQHHSPEAASKPSMVGLAKMRLDGFICLEAKAETGTIITKPFQLLANRLEVNVDAKDGWIKVELLDASGKEIADFSGNNAKIHHGVDELRLTPTWNSPDGLSQLKGKTIKLRFTLQNARLYAFGLN